MDLITLGLLAAAGWFGYRVIEKDNLFLGAKTLKEDTKDLGTHGKECLRTGVKAFKKSRAEGQRILAEQKLEYLRQGKTWESEEFKRNRERVKMVKETYRPLQTKLDKEAKESQTALEEAEREILTFE